MDIFFFQAEDGIRDTSVTGVQTCALPISDADDVAKLGAPGAMVGGRGSVPRSSRQVVTANRAASAVSVATAVERGAVTMSARLRDWSRWLSLSGPEQEACPDCAD